MNKYATFEVGKWHGMVHIATGSITAHSGCSHSNQYVIEANVSDYISAFPHTDRDFIILAAGDLLR